MDGRSYRVNIVLFDGYSITHEDKNLSRNLYYLEKGILINNIEHIPINLYCNGIKIESITNIIKNKYNSDWIEIEL